MPLIYEVIYDRVMEYDLITFDCYGTLIDWETGIETAFRSMAESFGKQVDREQIMALYMEEEANVEAERYRSYREVLTETARRIARRLGIELSPEQAAFLPESVKEWEAFGDTNEALDRLGRQYSLGILSNVDDDLLALTRRKFSVDFDLIVTAQQVKSYKPMAGHFEEARFRSSGRMQLHAAQSYYHDVAPCLELGVPVVWVNRKNEDLPDSGKGRVREVSSLTSLADLLT